jgi:hypothetical protein
MDSVYALLKSKVNEIICRNNNLSHNALFKWPFGLRQFSGKLGGD